MARNRTDESAGWINGKNLGEFRKRGLNVFAKFFMGFQAQAVSHVDQGQTANSQ
jgi:hypothetical protein